MILGFLSLSVIALENKINMYLDNKNEPMTCDFKGRTTCWWPLQDTIVVRDSGCYRQCTRAKNCANTLANQVFATY